LEQRAPDHGAAGPARQALGAARDLGAARRRAGHLSRAPGSLRRHVVERARAAAGRARRRGRGVRFGWRRLRADRGGKAAAHGVRAARGVGSPLGAPNAPVRCAVSLNRRSSQRPFANRTSRVLEVLSTWMNANGRLPVTWWQISAITPP